MQRDQVAVCLQVCGLVVARLNGCDQTLKCFVLVASTSPPASRVIQEAGIVSPSGNDLLKKLRRFGVIFLPESSSRLLEQIANRCGLCVLRS